MDKATAKGTIDELVGSAKSHAGKLTGNTGVRIEGAVQQIEGKAEKAVGNVKDAVRETHDTLAAALDAHEEAERRQHEVQLAEDRNRL